MLPVQHWEKCTTQDYKPWIQVPTILNNPKNNQKSYRLKNILNRVFWSWYAWKQSMQFYKKLILERTFHKFNLCQKSWSRKLNWYYQVKARWIQIFNVKNQLAFIFLEKYTIVCVAFAQHQFPSNLYPHLLFPGTSHLWHRLDINIMPEPLKQTNVPRTASCNPSKITRIWGNVQFN